MHRKMPLPRGWKGRGRSSVLQCVAQFTCWNNGPFTAHVVQYTRLGSYAATDRSSSENEADGVFGKDR